MPKDYPLHELYDLRTKFVLVGLTGITGSGCTEFAELLEKEFDLWDLGQMRDDAELEKMGDSNDKSTVVFAREFRMCRDICKKQLKDLIFTTIKYKDVLLLSCLKTLANNYESYEKFVAAFIDVLRDKFHHSYQTEEPYKVDYDFEAAHIADCGIDKSLYDKLKDLGEDTHKTAQLYFFDGFQDVCNKFYDLLKKRDYYLKNFFVHRLGNAIRATGNPESKYDDFKDKTDSDHIFDIVILINELFKGYHKIHENKPRRFAIDCLRNSFEIAYLRERYHSFYMIALHNDGREVVEIDEKLSECCSDADKRKTMTDLMMNLSRGEKKLDDFEQGKFFGPDISRCVSESEIHIAFRRKDELANQVENAKEDIYTNSFYSYTEQWMKFAALIIRPGLITPTRDERCMSMAYVAKYNSGCISRQVGCVIVDKENAVQSVGWNDPPANQIPCNLRYADELIEKKERHSGHENEKSEYRVYSAFELNDNQEYQPKDKEGNVKYKANGYVGCMMKRKNDSASAKLKEQGLRYSYCFRSTYNEFKGNKDNVNTRSLHAEENTMLRIAHRGGVGLDGGRMYVTASPCILCSKKAYQIGIKDIIYLDPYTDIAPDLILNCGFAIPRLRPFQGAIGATFNKLYQPFLPYKDEVGIYEQKYK